MVMMHSKTKRRWKSLTIDELMALLSRQQTPHYHLEGQERITITQIHPRCKDKTDNSQRTLQ